MEYAGSYALFNYRLEDPAAGLDYSNLRLIRAFEHGLDPTSSEAGFVLVHVDMVRNSGPLVAGAVDALEACAGVKPGTAIEGRRTQRKSAQHAPSYAAYQQRHGDHVGQVQAHVVHELPDVYLRHHVAVHVPRRGGVRGRERRQAPVLPRRIGRQRLHGAAVRQPAPDPHARNPLTEILKDFRQYRPSNHREFLMWVKERSAGLGLKDWALRPDLTESQEGRDLSAGEKEEIKESRRLWIQILSQVRDFRWRHWCFAREYILKRTSHPTATGGSPIVTWLPNQLQAVLGGNLALVRDPGRRSFWRVDLGSECHDIMDLVQRQKETLAKEVKKYCDERGVSPQS